MSRSPVAARRAAAELAAHRRRLLHFLADTDSSDRGWFSVLEADPTDALLFRAEETDHHDGLLRLAAAALSSPPEPPRDFTPLPLALPPSESQPSASPSSAQTSVSTAGMGERSVAKADPSSGRALPSGATADLQTTDQKFLRIDGSGPEGQACSPQGGASKQSNFGSSAPLVKPKHAFVERTEHGKDAGCANSSAICATEDIAGRRFEAARAESEPTEGTHQSNTRRTL